MPVRHAIAAVALALGLAACSPDGGRDAKIEPPKPAPEAPEPKLAKTWSDVLQPLIPARIGEAQLMGELGCSFTASNDVLVMVAMGNVASKEPAQAVLEVDDLRRVTAPGGFDAMIKGATFTGKDFSATIATTGEATGGGESPPHPATLTLAGGDLETATVRGTWTCGP